MRSSGGEERYRQAHLGQLLLRPRACCSISAARPATGDHRFQRPRRPARVVARDQPFRVRVPARRSLRVITAHVRELYAEKYGFTSALSVQVLKNLAPVLQPLLTATADAARFGDTDPAVVPSVRRRHPPEAAEF